MEKEDPGNYVCQLYFYFQIITEINNQTAKLQASQEKKKKRGE